MNPDVRYYLSVFSRRLPLFLLISLSLSSAAGAIAMILPTVYSATSVMLLERPQIPAQMVGTTLIFEAREQLQIIQQRLLTRANLIEIARQFDVYPDLSDMSPDQIVASMRADTTFAATSGRDEATLLTISFEARTATIAAQVANDFVTRIQSDNARQRRRTAEEALSFFQQEVDTLNTELDLQSSKILKFQNENADALPGSLDLRMNRTSLLQERLSQMSRTKAALEDQRARLVDLFNRTGRVGGRPPEALSFEEKQLEGLRNQLSAALGIYSDGSPQITMLRRQVDAMEAVVASQVAGRAGVETTESGEISPSSLMELQLAEADGQLRILNGEIASTQAELSKLEESISRTPANTIELENLERDYNNVQQQYNRALDRLSSAETTERIEVLSKGQRLTVIEQAVAPSSPSSPNRPKIAAAGVALGLGVAGFVVVTLEVLNKSIRRPVDLVRGLGITPIATIPYISTVGERLRRRMVILAILLGVIVGIPALLYVVHYQVMPLDLIADKIIDKIRY